MVHVFMIGGVLIGSFAFPALLFAAFEGTGMTVPVVGLVLATGLVLLAMSLSSTGFSPDYLMVMRMMAGGLTSYVFFSRRR